MIRRRICDSSVAPAAPTSLNPAEMFSVFNMGLGMVLIVSKKREKEAVRQTGGRVVGEIVEGSQTVVFV